MIAKINLLPWREEYRNEKRVEFLKIAGAVVLLACVVVFGWDRIVNARIDNQRVRNQMLNQKIAELEVQVKELAKLKKRRQQLIDRMTVIQSLQSDRPEIVRIFDEMVTAVPDGVYLSQLKRVGDALSFSGFAESNNRVSTYMRNLSDSYKFSDPVLTKVVANEKLGEEGNTFDMRVRITAPVKVTSEGEGK